MSTANKKRSFVEVEPSSDEETRFTIKKRKNDFSERTWWMVDMEACESNQGATGLVKRCMREYDWSFDKSNKVLKAYRQFLTLKKAWRDWDAKIFSHSYFVDKMWRQHILDISNYYHDMVMLCGHIVLRNPDGALDWEAENARDRKTRIELLKNFGSKNLDSRVWGFPFAVPEKDSSKPVAIFFKNMTGKEYEFRTRADARVLPLLEDFAKLIKTPFEDVRFLHHRIQLEVDWNDTSASLGLKDGDRIKVVLRLRGC